MTVVMICRLFNPHLGGVEKHVEEISKKATDDGHQVIVITQQHDVDLLKTEKINDVQIYRITNKSKNKILLRIEIWSWMIYHLWLFASADVIHVHDVFFWVWPIRIILFWKKIFITFHGYEAGYKKPNKNSIRARKIANRFSDGSIGVGSWIEKWYGTKLDVVTYGAVKEEV